MRSERAWVWLTAGVMALGLNGAYQDGQFAWVHRLAERSTAMVQEVRDQGCRLAAVAQLMLGHEPSTVASAQDQLARAQDQLARVQDRFSRGQMDRMQRQLEMAQFKVERAQRMVVFQQDEPCSHSHRFMVQVPEVDVPAVNVRAYVPNVNIPDVRVPSVRIPEINIPQITIPRINVPSVTVPEVRVPSMRVRVDDDNNGPI